MVQEGEFEEFYTITPGAGSTNVEKQYYLTVTLAGYGIVACVAMQSGCSQTKQPKDLVFWHQRLVEFGVGTQETQDMLARTAWTVCSLLDYPGMPTLAH